MNAQALKKRFEQLFEQEKWTYTWDSEKDSFAVAFEGQEKPVEVSIPRLLQRIETESVSADEIIQETITALKVVQDSLAARDSKRLAELQDQVYPVMRSTSFPVETSNGKQLVHDEHTAEARIYYALDLGQSYTLIDEGMLQESNWSKQELKERALFNLRRLPNEAKIDEVAGNTFYFISTTDGYAASRILNHSLIHEYASKVQGDLCVAIPHQDVLILADLRNEAGYDVMGQMCFHFYTKGSLPITALPFQLKEGALEPIFILAKRKPPAKK